MITPHLPFAKRANFFNFKQLILNLIGALILISFASPLRAQTVSIPDPGLNAAVREALQKPIGPLTALDLLSLTNLEASTRNITNLAGLEAAHNLTFLDLESNKLANLSFPTGLTNLAFLDVNGNSMTNLSLPNGLTNLIALDAERNSLATLILPADLNALAFLELADNSLASFTLPPSLTNLELIDIGFNPLTNCLLPNGLKKLDTLVLQGDALSNFTLPSGLTGLTELDISINELTSLTVRPDMTNLVSLIAFNNQLTNLTLPGNLTRLGGLALDHNQLRSLILPVGLTNLSSFGARDNLLTNLFFSSSMTKLNFVDVTDNQLLALTFPAGLTNLIFVSAAGNKLGRLTLPEGMTNLTSLFLQGNQLTNLVLTSDLKNLVQLDIRTNLLSSFTLPLGLDNFSVLTVDASSIGFLALPETLAAGNLAATVAVLQNQGVSIFTYSLTSQLIRPRQLTGIFQFAIDGPPGVYTVFGSTNLADWQVIRTVVNNPGRIGFNDGESHLFSRRFYRTQLQNVPPNMVFIPPTTFTLGSSTNEFGHQPDESPQTTVTLSRGFWMSKFLVTQADYLAVTGSNPSGFPGDLNRPVESVTWPAATNFCALLTARDLAAGRIPTGSFYRLPTEAEWECAARAGTTTRFYYGDDPDLSDVTNHAWFGANSGLVPHAVGQKEPNDLGLYDMEGNVWEWCQDWYGPYPGGTITDPQGPAVSSPIVGEKAMRGGAWEASEFDCRSARRGFEPANPFSSDFIIGFRVVLDAGL